MNKIISEFSVESHFAGKAPNVHKTYNQLLKVLRQFGPVSEEPKKTSIHLVNTTALAGVATRKDYLILTIKSDRKLTSPRIYKTEQVSAKRFHSEVKLVSPEDIDNELIGWLKDAYTLSA
jgi:hypothetical protein